MTFQAKILDDGRLVFPPEVARALGLGPGDAFEIDVREGEVHVDRASLLEQSLRRLMKQPKVVAAVDDFIDWKREEARLEEERMGRLG
jgi:AbrB family looped-hinge helix DNA binding protein